MIQLEDGTPVMFRTDGRMVFAEAVQCEDCLGWFYRNAMHTEDMGQFNEMNPGDRLKVAYPNCEPVIYTLLDHALYELAGWEEKRGIAVCYDCYQSEED